MNTKILNNYWGAGGVSFDPLSLSPYLWINSVNGDYVSTVDNNGTRQPGNLIDSATDETGKTLTISGTDTSKPIYNGVGWFFKTTAEITQGVAADYNFIHNGNDFDIFITYFQPYCASGAIRSFVNNNAFSNTARGILLYYDNTSNLNALKLRIGNGASSVISRDSNNAITQNSINRIRVRKSGNTVTIFVNEVQVNTQTNTGWSVSDAAAAMKICTATAASARVYLLDLFIIDRALSTDEATSMYSRTFSVPACTNINTYLLAGDSNGAGRGLNNIIAGDLTGSIDNTLISKFSGANTVQWTGELEINKNQTYFTEQPTTYHGAEMRFMKSMSAVGDVAMIKYGIGSTSVFYNWRASLPSAEFFKFTQQVIKPSLEHMIHTHRINPVFRGLIWIQGANDADIGNDNVAWTRSGATITVTDSNHGRTTGQSIPIVASSDLSAIPLGEYTITVTNANVFTFTGVNAGAASGTMTYSGGSQYKPLFTSIINGIVDYINNTLLNEATGGTGYSTSKLRLYIARTRTGTTFGATSFADTVAAQLDIGSNYLTDNPSYATKVKGTTSESTEDIPLFDAAHYTTAGYDTIGQRIFDYYDDFVNES